MIYTILAITAFIIGIFLLWKGSDILVDGTSKTAAGLGVSSLIISLIIVAFGTSAPEFAISVGAAFQNRADISLGNIIGSCVANILLVLGLSAVIRPIQIKKTIIRFYLIRQLTFTYQKHIIIIFISRKCYTPIAIVKLCCYF